jgi:HTH-type transcriptional regulator, transcriptional repressor of NAD biosynthesis genes
MTSNLKLEERAVSKPFRSGLVVGKFAPPHKGHQLLLETALNQCEHVIVLVYSNPDFSKMPSEIRASWIRELYPNASVIVPENVPHNDADDFTQREFVKQFLEREKIAVNAVFTSETYGAGFAAHLGVHHVLVDLERLQIPISGTRVRQDIHAHRGNLDPRIYRHFVQKIVFMGAESTGKSTLTERLALEYQTNFVPEYGREVWIQKSGILELQDYVHIAKHQLELEDAAMLESNQFLFVDTNAITTMFWCYAYEGNGLPELTDLAQSAEMRYDHVFVCNDDIPFVQDGWRDDAVWRSRQQSLILYDLTVRGVPYTIVSGSLEDRLVQVEKVLDPRAVGVFDFRINLSTG